MSSGVKAIKLGKIVHEYLVSDSRRKYGLVKPVKMVLNGTGIATIKGKLVAFQNDILSLDSSGKDLLIIDIQPFPASAGYWNGPDILFDIDDGRMEGSLVHDLAWHFVEDIAAELKLKERDVKKWSNKLFAVIWRAYAAEKGVIGKGAKIKSRIAASFTHPKVAGLWRWIKRFFLLLMVLLIQGCGGCLNIPDDWKVEERDKVKWERVENKEVDE